jgi:uncharacterized membrane protein YozB (DUF420 family)
MDANIPQPTGSWQIRKQEINHGHTDANFTASPLFFLFVLAYVTILLCLPSLINALESSIKYNYIFDIYIKNSIKQILQS